MRERFETRIELKVAFGCYRRGSHNGFGLQHVTRYAPHSGMRQNCIKGTNYHFWQQLFIIAFSSPVDNLQQMFLRYDTVRHCGLLSISGQLTSCPVYTDILFVAQVEGAPPPQLTPKYLNNYQSVPTTSDFLSLFLV